MEGELNGKGQRHAIVASRWNENITHSLLEGALLGLKKLGVEGEVSVIRVPGALELAPTARKLALLGKFDAIVCLGTIIRGATPHFDHVAGQTARLIAQTAYDTGVPVVFGVLTVDTIEQALERSGSKAGNKGYDAAFVAVEMASLYRQLEKL